MNVPERSADPFLTHADTPSPSSQGEMRFRADELASASPGADATGDLGARLRTAREARGMDLPACAQMLRLPMRVLARLEAGDFGNADDHVFTRGALHSYARLLGLPGFAVDSALRAVAPAQQPTLVATGSALRGRWLQRYGAAATYIVLTATVAVPLVWLGLRGGLDNQLTRIAPLDNAPAASAPAQVAQASKTPTSKSDSEQPLLASMTPFTAMNLDSSAAPQQTAQVQATPVASTVDHVLTLHANGDSWIEVIGAGGKTLESAMLHAGDTRSYHSTTPLSVTLGHADAVDVQSDGKPLSLETYRRANVARFTVFAPSQGNG